ncbi:MAG: DUF3047 domain-containing protein [Burkholderiales bacterium]|nr:DUF3047 domain-containing protein [Burkholderiales bacterium]
MLPPIRLAAITAVAALLAGCAGIPNEPPDPWPSRTVAAFSLASPNGALPGGWRPWRLSKLKKLTSYELVDYNGSVVVKAMSAASASGLMHPLDIDPRELPILQWRWKVPQLIPGANNKRRNAEDAPVRVVISFAGDIASLPPEDRMFFDRIRALTGHEMPYATLMYIWENRAPRGSVIPNPHSERVQMIVAETGETLTGTWKLESQNVYDDYKRAFGAEPGRIKAIAIMTDTDNTGASVEAYYGDIAFMSLREAERISTAPRR